MGRGILDEDDKEPTVQVQVVLIRENERSYLVVTPETSDEGVWISKSISTFEPGDEQEDPVLTLPRWLAEKEGLV